MEVDEYGLVEVLCFNCSALLGVTQVVPTQAEFCSRCRDEKGTCFVCPLQQACFDGKKFACPE
jgi:hypothetical protein